MTSNQRYAVVDMETSGTDVTKGDQVIQFSCSFVENGKIVDSYSTYVNNGEHIPQDITKLTGITEQTIKDAPSFDQLAPKIYQMLQGTVFVAHNVNFDFPFLNAELEKAGFPELEIKAIDTVTLTQLFFPKIESYHLRDLSKHFGIKHLHPHSSASDAEATAYLLIKIEHKIESLPLVTLQTILQVNPTLPRDTLEFIESLFKESQSHPKNLNKNLSVVDGIALRNIEFPQVENQELKLTFPKTKKQKERFFAGKLRYRESQAKMMNLIYRNFKDPEKKTLDLLIEAPTGAGKTLGFLLPMSILVQNGNHLVISTSTIALQEQMQKVVDTQLSKLKGRKINSVVLKGANHYLNLSKFKKSITLTDKSKQTQFVKCQVLIWLTETKTGDLDELSMSKAAPFMKQISFRTRSDLEENNAFSDFNFLKRQKAASIVSDIIIVNHNYLLANSKLLSQTLNERPYLVVDEAHQLANVAFENSRNSFKLGKLKKLLGRIKNNLYQTHQVNIAQIFQNDAEMTEKIVNLNEHVDSLFELNTEVLANFDKEILRKMPKKQTESTILKKTISSFIENNSDIFQRIEKEKQVFNDFLVEFEKKVDQGYERWTGSDQEKFAELSKNLKNIIKQIDIFGEVQAEKDVADEFFWIERGENRDPNSVVISSASFSSSTHLKGDVYQYFQPGVFTGSTLFTSKKSQFIFDALDLKREETKMQRMRSSFDYESQALMTVSRNTPEPQNQVNEEYVNYIANSIWKLINANTLPTLVLFNSLDLLSQVYEKLENDNNGKFTLLASGISGGQDKIVRRFKNEKNPVILGANAFWEGIDFPNNYLKQIIITRLPFSSPNEPVTSARIKYWKQQNKNPFFGFELPEAILKMKQGVGRLIRSSHDFGTISVLDNRILTKGYGNQIIDSLPRGLPVESGSVADMVKLNQEFFKKHK